MNSFSFVIPMRCINPLFISCLEKYKELHDLKIFDYEIILIIDFKEDNLKEIELIKNFNLNIEILESGEKGPSYKRNIAAKNSKKKFIIFIDDDAYPSKDYLNFLNSHISIKNEKFFAGPAITPSDDSFFSKLSSLFFENKFIGGFPERYNQSPKLNEKEVYDWPTVNFVAESNAFNKLSGFNENIWPGEDSEFCDRLYYHNYKILYLDKLIVYHYRRSNILKFSKQLYLYGFQRSKLLLNGSKNSSNIKYILPTILLFISIILTFKLNFFLLFLIFYYSSILIVSIQDIKKGLFKFVLLPIISYLGHISYGFGFLLSFFSKKLISKR